MIRYFALILILCSIGNVSCSESPFSFIEPDYRLPSDVQPELYSIHIRTKTNEKDSDFSGDVTINFTAIEPSDKIVLHQRGLSINSPAVLRIISPSTEFSLKDISTDPINDFLTVLTTDFPTKKDIKYSLTISFNGTLRTDGIGLFEATYRKADGKYRCAAEWEFVV